MTMCYEEAGTYIAVGFCSLVGPFVLNEEEICTCILCTCATGMQVFFCILLVRAQGNLVFQALFARRSRIPEIDLGKLRSALTNPDFKRGITPSLSRRQPNNPSSPTRTLSPGPARVSTARPLATREDTKHFKNGPN